MVVNTGIFFREGKLSRIRVEVACTFWSWQAFVHPSMPCEDIHWHCIISPETSINSTENMLFAAHSYRCICKITESIAATTHQLGAASAAGRARNAGRRPKSKPKNDGVLRTSEKGLISYLCSSVPAVCSKYYFANRWLLVPCKL